MTTHLLIEVPTPDPCRKTSQVGQVGLIASISLIHHVYPSEEKREQFYGTVSAVSRNKGGKTNLLAIAAHRASKFPILPRKPDPCFTPLPLIPLYLSETHLTLIYLFILSEGFTYFHICQTLYPEPRSTFVHGFALKTCLYQWQPYNSSERSCRYVCLGTSPFTFIIPKAASFSPSNVIDGVASTHFLD